MTPIRVGIVGARRVRQGLGPFVARELRAAGADVVAFAGTSEESVAAAAAELRSAGIDTARGHIGLGAMLESERLDAVAILSPAKTHAACLEAALAAGLHVLCEKPFVWEVPEPAAAARRLVSGFADRGLVLRENCQWPYALPAFDALHPGVAARGVPPQRFAMRLSPSAAGAPMLADALPHPLSLLQALCGESPGRIEGTRFSTRDPEAGRLEVGFTLAAGAARVAVRIELVGRSEPPREAWLAIDGHHARRTIRPGDYALALEDGGRVVPLRDPLGALIRDFVGAVAGHSPGAHTPRASDVVWRMDAICEIVRAFSAG